jgi:hypothetical protein
MTGAGYPSMSSSAQADDPVIADVSRSIFERQRILDAPPSRSMTGAGSPSMSSSVQADDPVIADVLDWMLRLQNLILEAAGQG